MNDNTLNEESTPRGFRTLAEEEFDGGIITATVGIGDEGDFESSVNFDGGGVMTSSEFREAADQYEAFPNWLRAFADKIDDARKEANK